MVTKKKICAGCNDLTYIYKNIKGKKYCKSCTYKLQPPKQITKMSKKQVFKITLKKELLEEDKKFYLDVWRDRFFYPNPYVPNTYKKVRTCQCENPECKVSLPDEPNLMYFHHILEKRNYPELRHLKENIAILCPDCHNKYETFPDKVPFLVKKREELFIKLLNQ